MSHTWTISKSSIKEEWQSSRSSRLKYSRSKTLSLTVLLGIDRLIHLKMRASSICRMHWLTFPDLLGWRKQNLRTLVARQRRFFRSEDKNSHQCKGLALKASSIPSTKLGMSLHLSTQNSLVTSTTPLVTRKSPRVLNQKSPRSKRLETTLSVGWARWVGKITLRIITREMTRFFKRAT